MNPNLFENISGSEQIKNESKLFWTVNKITSDGGIKQWIDGATFPRRGVCPPEAMFALNQVKRMIVSGVKMFGWKLLLVSPKKLIGGFCDMAWKVINPYIIKYEYLTPFAQEIQDITYAFIIKMGLKEDIALRFSKIICILFEYDDAYRFRLQDLFAETTKAEMIARPSKEISYLMQLNKDRDYKAVSDKFYMIGKMINLILLIPKYRKILVECFEDSNFEKLQPDDTDFYWMCIREDYKYGGFTNESRKKIMDNRGWVVPKSQEL